MANSKEKRKFFKRKKKLTVEEIREAHKRQDTATENLNDLLSQFSGAQKILEG